MVITVTTNADVAAVDGQCSLREALQNADECTYSTHFAINRFISCPSGCARLEAQIRY